MCNICHGICSLCRLQWLSLPAECGGGAPGGQGTVHCFHCGHIERLISHLNKSSSEHNSKYPREETSLGTNAGIASKLYYYHTNDIIIVQIKVMCS